MMSGALYLNKLESSLPKDASCQVWLNFGPVVLEKKIVFNFVNVVCLFHNYIPLERVGPFIWTNTNPLHPRMLCAKFSWNWPSGSWEDVENKKKYWKTDRQTDRQMDRQTDWQTDRRRTKGDQKKTHLSFQLSWAENHRRTWTSYCSRKLNRQNRLKNYVYFFVTYKCSCVWNI